MSFPLRRARAVAVCAAVLLASACGGSSDDADAPAVGGGEPSASRLDAVTIAGDVGSAPEVTWSSRMSATDIEAETITEGDGPEVTGDQQVLAQVWIGNGSLEDQAYSSYDDGGAAQLVSAGEDSIPAIREAITGATVGSRVAVTASAAEAFGEDPETFAGNPSLGIGNEDTLLVVVDLLSALQDAPDGAESAPEDWVPAVTETDGVPSALDFAAVPAPTGKFRKDVLFEGTGPRVTSGQTVAVRYLGQVYGGAQPFDENFSTTPTAFQIGVGKVIQGWDKNVRGSNVGSRIVIEVPPALGYGTAGNPNAGISGTDTLYFVIDILAAA